MPGPILWGPNNTSNNLQSALQLNGGATLTDNGVRNYAAPVGTFKSGLNGWATGTITVTGGIPTGTPTFNTASTGTTLGLNSTTPIAVPTGGAGQSLQAVYSGAGGGMIASPAFPVDSEGQMKNLQLKFSYRADVATSLNFSGTNVNSLGAAIWDVTNSVWLPFSGNWNFTQTIGVGTFSGLAQTLPTTASVRIVIYLVTSIGTATVSFDNFYYGPQPFAQGPAISDWQSYTPTISATTTAPTLPTSATTNFRWRRVGDSMEVTGQILSTSTTGAAAGSGAYLFSIPSGFTIDTSKIQITAGQTLVGWSRVIDSVNNWMGGVGVYITNPQYLYLIGKFSTSGTSATSIVDTTIGSGFFPFTDPNVNVAYSYYALLPIVGWSSNTVMSADSDTRVLSTSVFNSGSQSVTASTTDMSFPSINIDRGGSWNGTQFKVGVAGDYLVSPSVIFAASSTSVVYLNGSLFGFSGTSPGTNTVSAGSLLIPGCKPGDLISIRSTVSTTVNANSGCSFFRLSGPAVVQATDRIACRYYSSSTTISSTLTTVAFSTKDFDTTNSYNTTSGLWTCPATSYYQAQSSISTSATYVLNSTTVIQIVQSGSSTHTAEQDDYAGGGVNSLSVTVGDVFFCQAGDTLQVKVSTSGGTPAITSSTTRNWFSIAKVGGLG